MVRNYQTYKVLDFITDESFKSWVLEPTVESSYFWQSWIDSHPEKADEVARAREFILSVNFKRHSVLDDRKMIIYNHVMKKSRQQSLVPTRQVNSSFPNSFIIFKVAASIALVVSLSLIIFFSGKENQVNKSVVFISKTARRGEKLTLMLPDGSMVKLNAESRLKYSSSFGKRRLVYLEGEAYFEVERDTLRPFIVMTGGVSTEVLGTTFNVNNSSGDSTVQVAVTSGKVAVTSPYVNEKFYLLPQEVLTCEPDKFTKGYFDEKLLLGWKDGLLVFKDADIDEITRQLSKWYGVEFEISGRKGVIRKYTGTFANKSLRQVLEGISYASNIKFQIEQNKVFIELK